MRARRPAPTRAAIAAVSVTRPNRVASAAGSIASSPNPPAATSTSPAATTIVSTRRRPGSSRRRPVSAAPPPTSTPARNRNRRAYRGERRAAAGGQRRNRSGRARTDGEGEDARDQMPVVRDDAPADGVRAPGQPGPEGKDERAVVPGQPVRMPREHRPPARVDDAVSPGRADLVVEEQLDVLRCGREHGPVCRLRPDEPGVGSRPRRECEREQNGRDERAPQPAN